MKRLRSQVIIFVAAMLCQPLGGKFTEPDSLTRSSSERDFFNLSEVGDDMKSKILRALIELKRLGESVNWSRLNPQRKELESSTTFSRVAPKQDYSPGKSSKQKYDDLDYLEDDFLNEFNEDYGVHDGRSGVSGSRELLQNRGMMMTRPPRGRRFGKGFDTAFGKKGFGKKSGGWGYAIGKKGGKKGKKHYGMAGKKSEKGKGMLPPYPDLTPASPIASPLAIFPFAPALPPTFPPVAPFPQPFQDITRPPTNFPTPEPKTSAPVQPPVIPPFTPPPTEMPSFAPITEAPTKTPTGKPTLKPTNRPSLKPVNPLTMYPTSKPKTKAPMTKAPGTEAPVTKAPMTKAPGTEAPATKVPNTMAPATSKPSKTKEPVTKAPITKAPKTKEPVTEAPATKAPKTKEPVTEAPVTKAPKTKQPVTDAPVTKAPKTKKPTMNAPKTKKPTTKAPVTEAPATIAPVKASLSDAPVTEVPSDGPDRTAYPTPTGPFTRCFPDDSPTIGCPDADIGEQCDKYNPLSSFSKCFATCIDAFCCIHDSGSTRAPSCSKEKNCIFYDPCYIIWFKLHDTIGPAPYLRLDQNEAFFDVDAAEVEKIFLDRPDFFDQFFGHHFLTDDLPLEDSTFEDSKNW